MVAPRRLAVCALVLALAACGQVQQRFPDDVAAAIARDPMRRLETDRFIVYYAAPRHAEVLRFLARADRCAQVLRAAAAPQHPLDKMVVVMPDAPFNNAFVAPQLDGYEDVAVIPTYSTLDFTTEFGLVPDPGLIACHELTHYVHGQQIAGFWYYANQIFGHVYDPQVGFDPWLFEGLAVHYENALNPGLGRPAWPLFTGVFAAGYAGGGGLDGGSLSVFGRLATVGHHYLVGTMFVTFLAETYGEPALWAAIRAQSTGVVGVFSPASFGEAFGKPLGTLVEEFARWTAARVPVRARPPGQARLAVLGDDARYARGRDGTEAWIADDVDAPARLVVRDAHGAQLADLGIVEIVPPRLAVEAQPLLVSGLSITADGREVWLTALDRGATYEVPRLLRWRRGERGLTEVATGLGPGAGIAPRGDVYYYCAVDGDRWSLAAYDTRSGARRIVHAMAPGTYVAGARVSPDGARLVADVFDGQRFVGWELAAATGAIVRELRGGADGTPIFDASYLGDGRLMWLGTVAGRFQIVVEGRVVSDAPYAAFQPREAGGTIRFLDREGWAWELAEIPAPAPAPAPAPELAPPSATAVLAPAPAAYTGATADAPFSIFDHLFVPQSRGPMYILETNQVIAGLTLAGGDRVGLQRWSLTGYAEPYVAGDRRFHFGGDAEYLNMMLAPVRIFAQGTALTWAESITPTGFAPYVVQHDQQYATLALSRTLRDSLGVGLAGVYVGDGAHYPASPTLVRHVLGPQVSLAYAGDETTRYTGTRRGLDARAEVAYYPAGASSFAGDITDLGAAVTATLPMPWGRRHTLALGARGRALLASSDTGLLQVGGAGGGDVTATTAAQTPTFDDTRFPVGLQFYEPLRGYEDYAITTDRAAFTEATYRYPLIIDRGAANEWLLPAAFLGELDFEAFYAGALDADRREHAAVGGAVTAVFGIWRAHVALVYQLARRVRDDDALVQLVVIQAR